MYLENRELRAHVTNIPNTNDEWADISHHLTGCTDERVKDDFDRPWGFDRRFVLKHHFSCHFLHQHKIITFSSHSCVTVREGSCQFVVWQITNFYMYPSEFVNTFLFCSCVWAYPWPPHRSRAIWADSIKDQVAIGFNAQMILVTSLASSGVWEAYRRFP